MKLATKNDLATASPKYKSKHKLLGLNSQINKIASLKLDLEFRQNYQRLHIYFGLKKLFTAQNHLTANRYQCLDNWRFDWHTKCSGKFICLGKSNNGSGTMIKVFPLNDDGNYTVKIQLPRPLLPQYSKEIAVNFLVTDPELRHRKFGLDYALSTHKPITI